MELLQNSISGLQNLANTLLKDYNKYKTAPKVNAVILSIKANQIKTLQNCINNLNQALQLLTNLNNSTQVSLNNKETRIFKLEACLFYYGVSPIEIRLFTQKTETEITQLTKQNLKDNAFYKPLLHTMETLEPVKYATQPCFNFNQLKNKALNG